MKKRKRKNLNKKKINKNKKLKNLNSLTNKINNNNQVLRKKHNKIKKTNNVLQQRNKNLVKMIKTDINIKIDKRNKKIYKIVILKVIRAIMLIRIQINWINI